MGKIFPKYYIAYFGLCNSFDNGCLFFRISNHAVLLGRPVSYQCSLIVHWFSWLEAVARLSMPQLKICTYNVHGFYDARERSGLEQIVKLMKEQQPDVLCLQVLKPPRFPQFNFDLKFLGVQHCWPANIEICIEIWTFAWMERMLYFIKPSSWGGWNHETKAKVVWILKIHFDYQIVKLKVHNSQNNREWQTALCDLLPLGLQGGAHEDAGDEKTGAQSAGDFPK